MKLKLIFIIVLLGGVGMVAFGATLPRSPRHSTSVETSAVHAESLRYLSYDPQRFAQLDHQRRVLFFRAQWCATCAPAAQELSTQSSSIPSDMIVFEVDYDAEKELKKKYGVVSQHTFVQVDQEGRVVATWNGGALEELLERTL